MKRFRGPSWGPFFSRKHNKPDRRQLGLYAGINSLMRAQVAYLHEHELGVGGRGIVAELRRGRMSILDMGPPHD